jgi:nitrite reductase/ring-hydroxylating ferredoxin subunit/uncharacterized membrane protein
MKSKVNIKSHPLHPILVPFPIAFFTGTLISHLVGWLMNMPDLLRTAYFLNIGGIGFALLAAVPGFLDFLYTVPPKSTGKKRAAKHGIINVTMLVCFAVALFFRSDSNHIIVALLEVIGVLLMIIAGWMGGTLVYRNQIGVDIRYAHAGKWNEASYNVNEGEIEVATTDELKINSMKLLHVRNKRIVLARTEDRYVAFDDRCTHRGGSLASGSTMCNTVQCPWHGSQFDLITGAVKAGPAQEPIKTYAIKESQGKILLVL